MPARKTSIVVISRREWRDRIQPQIDAENRRIYRARLRARLLRRELAADTVPTCVIDATGVILAELDDLV
jgi:hypothetical protein